MRMKIIIYIAAIFSLVLSCQNNRHLVTLVEPRIGSWGDQGDGTFVNPILNSNYPDSDVEKYGDNWYMISSKGRFMKGMTLLKSSDLVNWEICGGLVDSLTWDTKEGVWAGDLSFRADSVLCHFIDIDKGLFVSCAENVNSEWDEPLLMMEKKGMTDPAVYWDEDSHQAYMLCNHRITETPEGNLYHLRLFRMSWDGKSVLDDGVDIYSGIGSEAAKIYRIRGMYYVFISEWTMDGNGHKVDRRQAVLRSESLYGPFEKRILLERGNGITRSCCQGSFLQAPDSSWWYMHQMVQARNTFEGRPQCLIPAGWTEDGWPYVGVDSDGNGIGNIVWKSRKPIQCGKITVPDTDDDFNFPELGSQWLWNGNPISGKWSLTRRKGWLRLCSTTPGIKANPFIDQSNILLQRKMGRGRDTVTVKMSISGMSAGQYAGLVFTGENYQALGVHAGENGRVILSRNTAESAEAPFNSKNVLLRICADERILSCSYSTDGKRYVTIGEPFEMFTSGFNGIFIGLFSRHPEGLGYADFDWFSYEYDGPKAKALSK